MKGSSSRLTEIVMDDTDSVRVQTGGSAFGARGLKMCRMAAIAKKLGDQHCCDEGSHRGLGKQSV